MAPAPRRLTRDIASRLERWREDPRHKPLLLRGARQVGKTWSLMDFGRRYYSNIARVDFMADVGARSFFESNLDPHAIVRNISIYTNEPINPKTTLIVLDEIQECPRALTALKYFCEQAPEYDVVATGSYMGVSRHQNVSFPVGKVDFLTMRPLSFAEFLDNCGQKGLAGLIRSGKPETISTGFSERLANLLRAYLVVGGMPEAVTAYLDSPGDLGTVRERQRSILAAYDLDFSKYAEPRLLDRLRLVWSSLPAQLSKENKKFQYKLLREGARARAFEECIAWLIDYGVVCRVPLVTALRPPLKAYQSPTGFKLFALDTGLLGAMAGIDPRVVIQGSKVFTEFKGALTEQYVCQQLVVQGYEPFYWADGRKSAETDFDVDQDGDVFPIEVKSGRNVHEHSLQVAYDHFGLAHAVRTSLLDYADQGWLTNIPLWAIDGLRPFIERHKDGWKHSGR